MWGDTHPLERAAKFAIEYNQSKVEPPDFQFPSVDEIIRDVLSNKIVPFLIWAFKTLFATFALAILSICSYAILHRGIIMRGLEVKSHPIFFDYSPENYHMPRGVVDLLSSRIAPWVYTGTTKDDAGEESTVRSLDRNTESCAENFVCKVENGTSCGNHDGAPLIKNFKHLKEDEQPHSSAILNQGQQYFFEVVLTLPESEINQQLGIFMVSVQLQSSDGFNLATSKQATMLPYESKIVTTFRKFSLTLPFASGLLSETKTIHLLCFDKYVDRDEKRPLSKVEIRLDIPNPAAFPSTLHTIQIQSSELRYGKEMSQTQLFFRNWGYSCAFCGVTIIFLWYSFLVLLVLHHRAKRKRHRDFIQQPYHDFFDSINNESAIGSNSGSWMGADIEILDDDNESDVWEPIGSNSNAKKQEGHSSANDASNIISDSESITSENHVRSSQTEHHFPKTSLTIEFPSGTIAKNPLLQSHKPMFSPTPRTNNEQNTTEKKDNEEKCLVDMVMKGYSKWEIFTGEVLC